MKHRYIICLIMVCVFMIACQNEKKAIPSGDTGTMSEGTGKDGIVGNSEAEPVSGFAQTEGNIFLEEEEGVYFFPYFGYFLYYWNFEQDICVPVCGKANCLHEDETCNAYVNMASGTTLQCVEDYLYVWAKPSGTDSVLYRMKPDGTDREKVCALQTEDRANGTVVYSDIIGQECYVIVEYNQDRNGSDVNGLYRVDLNTGKAELISMNNDDTDWIEHRMYDLTVEGKYVYYRITEYRPEEARSRIFRYDMETKEKELIYETDRNLSFVIVDGQLVGYFMDDGWGYTGKVCVVSLETGETIKETEYTGYLTYDGTYFYIGDPDDENPVYYICDKNFNLIDTFESAFDISNGIVFRGTSDSSIFFMQQRIKDDTDAVFEYRIYPKAEIAQSEHHYYSTVIDVSAP